MAIPHKRIAHWTCLFLVACLTGAASQPTWAQEVVAKPMEGESVDHFISEWTGSALYPSQYGPVGWPGTISEVAEELDVGWGHKWGFAERIPYPGSVEHVRSEWQRYMPPVPLYNANTLVRKFTAEQIPGIEPQRLTQHAEPVYWVPKYSVHYKHSRSETRAGAAGYKTSEYREPVTVLTWDQTHDPIELDLGVLPPSTYAVRIIAATETPYVQFSTLRLVFNCEVNDGLNGEVNRYHKRSTALDEFYQVGMFTFKIDHDQPVRLKLSIDSSSRMPLLLHTIDVHDRLALIARRAGKRSATYYNAEERAAQWAEKGTARPDPRSEAERFAADLAIWEARPPANVQTLGADQYWGPLHYSAVSLIPEGVEDDGMGIDFYGSDMLWNRDAQFVNENNRSHREAVMIGQSQNLQRQTAYRAASAQGQRVGAVWESLRPRNRDSRARRYHETGDEVAGRTAAVELAVLGWMNLMAVGNRSENMSALDLIPTIMADHHDVAYRARYKEVSRRTLSGEYAVVYDQLFPYIQGNEDLARSLGRFIPEIQSAEDLVAYFDTTILQLPAHMEITYNTFSGSTNGSRVAQLIAVQQDTVLTKPWVEWLFRYVFMYPLTAQGIDELAVNAFNRDGTEKRGSTFYATIADQPLPTVLEAMELYQEQGGTLPRSLPQLDDSPKAQAALRWQFDQQVAGGYTFWIGDVSGPSRPRTPENDPRLGTRVLAEWFGVLETNTEAEDFRARRAAGLRVNWGLGHAHHDPLDLQIWAHGVPMAGDGGGRAQAGYGVPGTVTIEAHNTVISPSLAPDRTHSWVSSIADTAGAQYMEASLLTAEPDMYRRQIALIDVPGPGDHSYVIDVFRVRGADETPTYAFHGPPADEMTTNARGVTKGAPYFTLDPETAWNGRTPDRFVSTWRMRRDPHEYKWINPEGRPMQLEVPGAERNAMGDAFSEDEPRKFIRMHLLGHEDAIAFGIRMFVFRGFPFTNDMLFVQPADGGGEAVFPVVFEPFNGDNVIALPRLLTPEAVHDASAPVAFEVRLKGGVRDVIYMAPRDSEPTTIEGVGTIQGEYAYLSFDQDGLRQATLVGGTQLEVDQVNIKTDRAAYTGTMQSIDYATRMAEFSEPLPAEALGSVIEIGPKARPTSYTLDAVNGRQVQFDKGADFALYRVRGFLEEYDVPEMHDVIPQIIPGVHIQKDDTGEHWFVGEQVMSGPKEDLHWAQGGRTHPVDLKPWVRGLNLVDGPSPKATLSVGDTLSAYEIGVGDAYRLPVRVNVQRGEDGRYTVTGNVTASVQVGDESFAQAVQLSSQ